MNVELTKMIRIIKITEVLENPSALCSTDIVIGIDVCGIRSYFDEIYPFLQKRL
jgi:hypothetical protein